MLHLRWSSRQSLNHLRCLQNLGCAPRPRSSAAGAMASPIRFRTPSGSRRKSGFTVSSSPDLPSVNDILSRTRRQNTGFTASTGPARTLTTEDRPTAMGHATFEIEDNSVIEIPPDSFPKPIEIRPRGIQSTANATSEKRKNMKSRGGRNSEGMGRNLQGPVAEADVESAQSAFIPAAKPSQKPAKAMQDAANEPLCLEAAMTRRVDWTPPSQKQPIFLNSASPALDAALAQEGSSDREQSFEKILESYRCSESTVAPSEGARVLKRRKMIELVSTATPGASSTVLAEAQKAPVKRKAAKKKARTITELATAAYRAQSPDETAPTTILTDFANQTSEKENGARSKSKTGGAKPRKRASKKKPASPEAILLPPTEALKEVANQDFVFGTSSQLAVEKSPTFLRCLQDAMRESNQFGSFDIQGSWDNDVMEPPTQRPTLWDAGARDETGELFDFDSQVSDTAGAAPSEHNDPFGYLPVGEKAWIVELDRPQTDDPFADTMSDELPSFGLDLGRPSDRERPVLGVEAQTAVESPLCGSPRNLGVDAEMPRPSDDRDDRVGGVSQPPSYTLYTDAQLSKEVTWYGFKPVKSRKAKIALLEQCWQSRAPAGQPSVGLSASMTTKASPSPDHPPEAKRRRGRPRKNLVGASEPQEPPPSAQPAASPGRSSTRAASKPRRGRPRKQQPLVEIPDSDSESARSASPPVDFSLMDAEEALDSRDQQPGLSAHITRAVTTAPRTRDPTNPSWHEKMLLYDPIILEDLAAWLNGGELRRVGYDGEVSTGEVKKWCEARSICCLKRMNLRGRERKRL